MSQKVYEIVTARILSELEKGIVPWQQPWTSQLAPQNFISKKPYKGINALVLSIASQHFGCPYFATLKQIKRLGGRILNREWKQNSLVCFWRWILVEDEKSGEKRPVGFLRYTRVWSLAQTQGITWELPEKRTNDPIEECERIVQGYSDGPSISHEQSVHSYYSVDNDEVHLPDPDWFVDSVSYYSVLFHELIHSTGHRTRLDRNLSSEMASKAYAREELTGEIGAAFLLSQAGHVGAEPLPNSIAYIQYWHKRLQDDPRCVVCAASRADRAASWVLGVRENSDSKTEAEEREVCYESV